MNVMARSVQVLVSHLIWVVMGVRILGLALKSFFNREKVIRGVRRGVI